MRSGRGPAPRAEGAGSADIRSTVASLLGDPGFVLSLLDSVACLVVLLDGKGRILHWNSSCEALTGRTLAEARGRQLWELVVAPEERPEVRRAFLEDQCTAGQCCENRWLGRDGSPASIAWSNSCLAARDGSVRCLLFTGMDVTGLRRAEEDARQAHRRVQEVLERLIRAQEEERRRVAFDVHDGLLQYVIAARMHLERLEKRVIERCPEEAEGFLLVRERVGEAIAEGRRIIAALRPSTLDDYGLVETVRRELNELRRETGWVVTLQADLSAPLPPAQETNLYRIYQEAVHNARRHSRTRRLLVEIGEEEGLVFLRVRDWGTGFGRARSGGMGLETLRERAEAFGGHCQIETLPGEGTTVEVRVPR